ncbi:MAG: DUF4954 family protein [Phycisphaerae bacterium]
MRTLMAAVDHTHAIPLADLIDPPGSDAEAFGARRDELSADLVGSARPVSDDEIAALQRNGCTCDDWSTVRVCDPFTPSLVRDVAFHGLVRIGSLTPRALRRDGLAVPTGIARATLVQCDIGADPAIGNIGLLARCCVGERCILQDVAAIDTTPDAHFGQGSVVRIATVNEAGGREVHPFASIRPADVVLQANRRDDGTLHEKLSGFADAARSIQPGSPGVIGDGACVLSAGRLRNVCIGPAAMVQAPALLDNVTLLSRREAPVRVGGNVTLRDGLVGPGCRVETGATAERFVLGENVTLKLAARVVDSAVGDNSTIACCEVVSALLMPAHEQHHNNSFLIAAQVGGVSNIAAGATIGSNHNSRSPDGEIHAGRGFWPGLCSSLKHNSRFASFTLLAKGSYPSELDIPLPFSLVSNGGGGSLLVMPAYWWMHNMYALMRTSWKVQRRDHRAIADQPIEFDPFGPDTAEEMLRGRRLLAIWAGKAYLGQAGQTWDGQDQDELARVGEQLFRREDQQPDRLDVLGEAMENSSRPVRVLKPRRAWHAYRQMLHYYAGRTLLSFLESAADLSPDALEQSLGAPRRTRWVNLGGQLVLESDVDALAEEIRTGALVGWEAVHERLDALQEAYPQRRCRHAAAVLKRILTTDKLNRNEWAHTLRELAALQKIVADEVVRTRRKDDVNPFRASTYRSQAEMKAVVGTVETNEFVAHIRRETDELLSRIEAVLRRF